MPSFGENLTELRKSRGYSQDKFAKAIGSNQVTVSSWEVGTRMPNVAMIKHIADTFKVPVSTLISLDETGMDDDYVRQVADILKNHDKIRLLFDKLKYLNEHDLNVVAGVIEAITRDRKE